MELLKALFSQGWVGSLIGITGLIIAFLLYKASRIGPRPTYQLRAMRLIGKEERALPEEVEILFRGRSVPQLTMTHVVLWNSGNATLNGKNIIVDDPLRLKFSERAEILRVRVLKVTRESNKFIAKINSCSPNEAICSFDYLDTGDGAVIELLHTAEERYPEVQGTIRGVPKGLLNYGRILPYGSRILSFPLSLRLILFIGLFFGVLIGILIISVGFLLPMIPESLVSTKPLIRWFFVIVGLMYVFLPLFVLWITRKRFPKSLAIEDIEEY